MLRCKAFKDSKETKCQLIKHHWFGRYFLTTLEKTNKMVKVITFDLTNNKKAFEFEIDLNKFNEAQKLCKDTVYFVKDEEAQKITKILMSIL